MEQNITLTAGANLNEDFTEGTAATTDKLMHVVYVNGAPVITKKSSNFGGSSNEISIVADTKYTVKLLPADTLNLPASGVTHKLYKYTAADTKPTVLYEGTVTVNSAVAPSESNVDSAPSFRFTGVYTSNGELDAQILQGHMLQKLLVRNTIGGDDVTLDFGTTDSGTELVTGLITSGTDFSVVFDSGLDNPENGIAANDALPIFISSADWQSQEIEVTVIYKRVL